MSPASVTVVIPTLAADPALTECLRSLEAQSHKDFEVIVVDNSGSGRARNLLPPGSPARVIENGANAGFGEAVNQGAETSQSAFVATLNDDAVACPEWLASLVRAMEKRPDVGMCASQVRLQGQSVLDSAGMLISTDASSTQRGHRDSPSLFAASADVLCPSGSAAIYRRTLFDQIGGFDKDFFLYCEDTDIGLRARWAGWKCLYVPKAVVEHRYSHSAGRASALKAFYVERNRLFVVVKNFPAGMLASALTASLSRYCWHVFFLLQGRGKAAEFAEGGGGFRLAWFVVRAHVSALAALPRLLAKRREIRAGARLPPAEFAQLLRRHSISPRQVAAH